MYGITCDLSGRYRSMIRIHTFTEATKVLGHKNVCGPKTVIYFEMVVIGLHIKEQKKDFLTINCNFYYEVV